MSCDGTGNDEHDMYNMQPVTLVTTSLEAVMEKAAVDT